MKKFYYTLTIFAYSLYITAQTTAPTGTSNEVGITEGQLSVSLSGGATYAVPIAVPPGINGIVPQVSLVYNSQGGNGMAGYGWNISGVSTITRISATKFHDETIDAVDFNSLDRFAFDGQRLIAKSGTYGANLTTYETENFSNIKITSYGVHPSGANYGPAYFIVEYPDGSKAQYGNSTDSRSITDWAIMYWENPQGVRISYSYILANNNLSIEYIKYGATTTNTPINQVKFVYRPRQRPEQAYIGGQSVIRNNILSEIQVTGNGGVGFRYYVLKQDPTSLLYERLTSITEKSSTGISYNPTVFTYGVANDSITYTNIFSNTSTEDISLYNNATVSGDFDGDGSMDFISYPITGTQTKSKFRLYPNLNNGVNSNTSVSYTSGLFEDIFASSLIKGDINTGYKLMQKQGWTLIKKSGLATIFSNYSSEIANPIYFQYEKNYQFPQAVYGYPKVCGDYSTWTNVYYDIPKSYVNGDFNGDGLTDVTVIEKEINYNPSSCSSFGIRSGGNSYFVNLDKRITNNSVVSSGTIISSSFSKFMVADFNGDGKSDIFVFDTGKVQVYSLNDANQFVLLTTRQDLEITLNDKVILIGDYNGDGKSDFLMPKYASKNDGHTEWYKYTSNGIDFIKEEQNYPGTTYPPNTANFVYRYIPMDYDNDGKTDLISLSNYSPNAQTNYGSARLAVNYNKNGTFNYNETLNVTTVTAVDLVNLDPYAIPIFYNSNQPNKKLEIACVRKNVIVYFQSKRDFSVESNLKSITTGNGVKETITYSPLVKDPCTYNCHPLYLANEGIENYPNVDISVAPGFQVVSMLEKESNSVKKKQLYAYNGAVSNMEGLGFQGFRSTMSTNWHDDTKIIISNISKFDMTKRGANSENYSVLYLFSPSSSFAPTDFISKSILTYNSVADALQTNKVFKLKNIFSEQFNGLDNTSSETTPLYDSDNNIIQSTTKVKNGVTVEQTTVTNLTYDKQTTGTYYIGRLINRTQSVTVAGDVMTSEEKYIYTNHLLTQIKKRGNDLNDYITEDNVYDAFGNIIKKTITVPAVAPNPAPDPRVTSYQYDTSGRFLIKSTDIEGLATNFVYNTSSGVLTSETNPYGLTTTYGYDVWFKKIKSTDYLTKSNTYTYVRSTEKTIVTTTGDDGSGSEETFDDLGRKIKSGVKNINGTFSYVDYLYDIYDRNYKTSEPYFGASATQWNETLYDNYGRPTQSTSFTGKKIDITYAGLTTTVDDHIKTKKSTKNAIGNVITMIDTPGGKIDYTYFANGNLKESNYDTVKTTITQDGWGRKTTLTDSSAGLYSYKYNLFGETTSETTPNGITSYNLDKFGKLESKTITDPNIGATNSTTAYTYDGISKLLIKTEFNDIISNTKITTEYIYDTKKRLSKVTETNSMGPVFIKDISYDSFGRTDVTKNTATLGSNSIVANQNFYKNGYLWQIKDSPNTKVLWETKDTNARGQLTSAVLGNTMTITNTYDTYGYVTKMQHDLGTTNVMKLETAFDVQRGNLTTRNNSLFGYKEAFQYDSQDRLISTITDDSFLNNTFSTTDTEGYQTEGGAIISSSGGALQTQATASGATVKKILLTGATIGDKITLNFTLQKIQGTDVLNVYIQEQDPSSGTVVKYLKTVATGGAISITHTVTQYSILNLRIEKANTTAINVFIIDNVTAAKQSTTTQDYDNRGRITKNDIGTYNYKDPDAQKAYRNTSVTLTPNALTYYQGKQNQNITYNTFKSPIQIEDVGIDKLSFVYNDNNDRSIMYYGGTQNDKLLRKYRKYYSADGSMEIKQDITTGGPIEFVTYIGGDAYTAPLLVKSDGTTQKYLYLHRDYQGSILAITDQAGAVIEKRLFDPWGSIVKVQNGAGVALAGLTALDRGYTGHEHLQSVGLINMNGRIYDPKLHRFLQPDNYVQEPFNTQNYNRYGYCWNNPLKYADYSGEFIWFAVIIGAVIGAYSGGAMANNGEYNIGNWNFNSSKTWGNMLGGAIVGAVSGYIGGTIATADIPFANTLGIASASLTNSIASNAYSGGHTDISVGFGFGSFNFSTGEFGYLGKKGNSFMENLGYGLGALANIADINQVINSTEATLNTDNSDFISHSSIKDKNTGNSLMSYGPDDNKVPSTKLGFALKLRKSTSDYHLAGTLPVDVTVNKYAVNLVRTLGKILPYQGATTNCVNMSSLSLWLNGIPNIGLHPYFLYATTWAYTAGIRPDLFSYYLQNH
ncbi:RHS repeat-associated core domain-containing protein [Flavobacterium sp. N3904]|uniref:RHS repeat-associated core domain-containing protein n=1 Tax=Flavobacterium sp. N3904 TaxID=2986835 RepID=UPI0022253227|nr:FG-GAP-like repeat-containing protein [Flavobacterium sp. N3904]